MKTKLIILGLLISSLGFGQVYSLDGGGTGTPTDTNSLSARIDLKLDAADTASLSDRIDAIDVSTYVTQDALVDSAFVVAEDLTGFLTGADTVSLDSRISAIDVSAYVTQTDLVDSAFVVAGDLTGYATETFVTEALDTLSLGFDEVTTADSVVMVNDGALSVMAANKLNWKQDTIPIFVFGLGGGLAADTAAFNDNAIAGSFYNSGSDTIHVTSLRGVLAEGSGTETVAVQVSWHTTFKSGSATNLNSSALTITSITTGDEDTSFANSVIPPGVFVWCTISGVSAGNKPSLLILQLSGYKVPTY